MTNEEIINKTIEVADMQFGGRLNPTQQDEFVRLVKDFSVMLKAARFKQMAQSRVTIDKLYIGEPITRGVGEYDSTARNAQAKFDQVELNASKLKSDWQITTEALQDNIEGENFEDVIMSMMTKRMSTDLETLAINGDVDLPNNGTPMNDLLRSQDGWAKQTDASFIVDNGGVGVSRSTFASMLRTLPEQYQQDPDLRWICSRAVATDWQEYVSERATAAGDDALRGNTLTPFGIPMFIVPSISSRLPLSVADATVAEHTGNQYGPFVIVTGDNDQLSFQSDGLPGVAEIAATPVTVPAGTYTAVELGNVIMSLLIAANVAWAGALQLTDNGTGLFLVRGTVTGLYSDGVSGQQITIAAGTNDMLPTLGLTAGTYASAAAGSGSQNEGTFIWLANPKNFIFGMVDDTRVYTEFDKDVDALETVIYNQVAMNVENTEAVVKAINVRAGAPVL